MRLAVSFRSFFSRLCVETSACADHFARMRARITDSQLAWHADILSQPILKAKSKSNGNKDSLLLRHTEGQAVGARVGWLKARLRSQN